MGAGLLVRAGSLLCWLGALPLPCAAQTGAPADAGAGIVISGQVEHPRTLGLADLQALPPVTVEVTQGTEHGTHTTSFTGALLLAVLETAGVHDDGPRSHLQHTFMARGRDGYAVALAIGEVDPAFENKQVLVAYAQDGRGLALPRLVVPGDTRAGRGVRELVAIEVR